MLTAFPARRLGSQPVYSWQDLHGNLTNPVGLPATGGFNYTIVIKADILFQSSHWNSVAPIVWSTPCLPPGAACVLNLVGDSASCSTSARVNSTYSQAGAPPPLEHALLARQQLRNSSVQCLPFPLPLLTGAGVSSGEPLCTLDGNKQLRMLFFTGNSIASDTLQSPSSGRTVILSKLAFVNAAPNSVVSSSLPEYGGAVSISAAALQVRRPCACASNDLRQWP